MGKLAIFRSFQEYYFRKLARYLNGSEYKHIKHLRASTTYQVSIPEMMFMRWAIRKFKPQTFVEIGSYCGASTSAIADQIKQLGQGKIYAIDLFSNSAVRDSHGSGYDAMFDRQMEPYQGWFEKVEGDSKTMAWSQSIDFLFIDGDHSEKGASSDIERFTPFVKQGGCVFLHDYVQEVKSDSMVRPVVERSLMQDPNFLLVGKVDSLIGFQRVSSALRASS